MKSFVPIAAALIIFAALVASTILYMTALMTLTGELYTYPAEEREVIQEELNGILLTAMRTSSYEANRTFFEVFLKEYNENFVNGINVTRTYRWYKITVWLYNYNDYNKRCDDPNLACVFSESYDTYNLRGFNSSRDSFLLALDKAASSASVIYRATLFNLTNNWMETRRSLGYLIDLVEYNVEYNVRAWHVRANGSYALSNLTAYVIVDVYSPWSGYFRVKSNISIIVTAYFYRGFRGYNEGFFAPINITARIYVNGVENNYIVDPGGVSFRLFSRSLSRIDSLETVPVNDTRMILLRNHAMFYMGNGVTQVIFLAPFKSGKNIWTTTIEVIRGLSLSDASYDDEFPPPESATPNYISNRVIYGHVLAYFWGGLMNVNVDGVLMNLGIITAFKYDYYTNPPYPYDWICRVRGFFGDPAVPPIS